MKIICKKYIEEFKLEIVVLILEHGYSPCCNRATLEPNFLKTLKIEVENHNRSYGI